MILILEHIAKSFGKKTVLKDISLNLNAKTIVGIVGENGSGKSVLMDIIVGLRKPQKGRIIKNGTIGYCPQNLMLFPHLTVKEHFIYFSSAYNLDDKQSKKQSEELMSHFNYKKYENERIKNLSGGTKQKLNLSISLLHQPDLLILDEPYNGFDWDTYLKFWSYTDKMRNSGSTILIVTHMLSEVERLDHLYEIKNGVLQ